MTDFIPEPGRATNPNAVSPPDPVYRTCGECGASLEDAREAVVGAAFSCVLYETVYLCDCGHWYAGDVGP